MQVTAAFRGANLVNEAAPYLAEYVTRKRLAKLGFTSPLDALDSLKADIFCMIDAEIDDLQAKEIKKKK